MQLRGSTGLVTGGASGLGAATARKLVDLGANVAILDLPGERGEATAASIGAGCVFIPADVTLPLASTYSGTVKYKKHAGQSASASGRL